MTDMIIVLVTTSSKEEALSLSQALLKDNLIACANIVEGCQSVFNWKGAVCNERESLMILKSISSRMEEIIETVTELHSYGVPEIIAIPVLSGSLDYLSWVEQETQRESF